jgi:signal transduction histidine kinase
MHFSAVSAKPHGLALLLGWRRLSFTLCASVALGLPFAFSWPSGPLPLLGLTIVLGLISMLAFGLFEQWPRRLPAWVARWVLQVSAVAAATPLGMFIIYLLIDDAGTSPFWREIGQLDGCVILGILGLLLTPWIALAALLRQKEAMARHQALAFHLERSELERQALDARLHLLQAQVAPHFLFNTLANVQMLVNSGSPQASTVLDSLIAYLRAAVPRLHEPATTFGQELQLVQAYLELMHMRMPDRLTFAMHVDEAALALRCPPMTLLTLVENAVAHGIDPSEEGGRIDVHIQRRGDRCIVRVSDTGVGLQSPGHGLGTGLTTLRQRLQLSFGAEAQLQVRAQHPHGACAELDLPAQGAAT